MIGLDTNVLVRYLAQDDAKQSAQATRIVEANLSTAEPGFVSLIALVETVWVLESCYRSQRAELVEVLERLQRIKQIHLQDAEVVARATRCFRSGKADFADCVLAQVGLAHGCSETVTFDKTAGSIEGMRMLAPAG